MLGGYNVFQYAPNPTHFIDPFGLSFDWGGYLSKTLGVPKPLDMENAHAHHIVFKQGSSAAKPILDKSKAILEAYNIDWLKGKENLIWAPNKGHSLENATRVLEALQDAHKDGKGSKADVVNALRRMGEAFADGSIENIEIKRHTITTVDGKKVALPCTK